MHICTECGREDDNIRSTSLCRDCQLVLMLNLAGDNQKEIARLQDIAKKAERFVRSDGRSDPPALYLELRRCFLDDK